MSIEILNGKKLFKDKLIFDNVNAKFNPGEVIGIIGRNGSGKTVLFKCIIGIYRLTGGTIKKDDKIIGKDIDILKNIGAIIESPGYSPSLTGFENLNLLYTINNKKNYNHIKNVMELVGLNPENKNKVKNYSLGMKQRLGIAQCIMEDPEIIILDEPMNGLDSKGVEDIRKIILDLKSRNKTIILSSHSKDDIEILCDRVYKMEDNTLMVI